jgi:hypothetical protein
MNRSPSHTGKVRVYHSRLDHQQELSSFWEESSAQVANQMIDPRLIELVIAKVRSGRIEIR